MSNAYFSLLEKLDRFIRKYYKNQILKGLILFLSLSLALFLALTLLEYFAYFNSTVRTVLFYSYLLINVLVISKLIIIPLSRLFKIGRIISYEQAARIIGEHFSEVKDQLLNTLQLKQISDNDATSIELINASIEQKIKKLSPVHFDTAIDFKINKKFLKFLLPPAIILLVILIASPAVVTEPTKRYYNYTSFFEKQAPFKFNVLNKNLEAIQQQDFLLNVKLTGDDIPNELFVVYNGNEYKLTKENVVLFNYTFKNIQKDLVFYLKADEFRSKDYKLKVIPKPIILDFEVQLNYPAYTGKKDESIQNSGDLSVPAGTNICWKLKTKDTKKLVLKFVDKTLLLDPVRDEIFLCSRNFLTSQNYTVIPQNNFIKNNDSLTYSINVVPDAYPTIDVKEYRDSVYYSHLYFKGSIKDDYGFNKLLFKYRKLKNDDNNIEEITNSIPINKLMNQGEFYHYFDVSSLEAEPGDQIEYYFEIWDNDGVGGSKATRSSKMVFKIPTEDELEKQSEKNNEDLKNKIDQTMKDISLLQKQADDISQKMLDKKNLNWQERKQIEDLLFKQQQLQENVEDIKEQLHENNISEQQFKMPDSNIIEKQKQLEELFNKIMTDEMKELFKQLQEMLDKLDKTKVNEMLDKIKMSNKDLEKELDRNLELFKQLELEKKMTEAIEKLQKLAEEQKNLSEKTTDEKKDQQDLLDQQKKINDDFEQVKQELKDMEKLNSELEDPKKLENTDEKQNSIQEELNNSKSNLENNKRKNASKSQKSAGDQMESLANDLQKMQEEMQAEELAEDAQALRQLLENLIKVSFSQEGLIDRLKTTNINDPKYLKIMDKQKELKDDLKMIEDSLFALSKRQSIIEPIVNKEISAINANVVKILDALHDRNIPQTQKWQQFVMTSVNNLALLLAESLEQMQQQMQSMSSKSCNKKGGKCSKPGNGKPSASTMKQMQDQLNKQMEGLKKQLENGQKPGQNGQQSMSEQLARLAAQQEAIRKMLQQYGDDQKKEGVGNAGEISDMMKKMEQTETDLVNKIINNETLKRQQEILTRLLESEKAEKERELDEKRKSNEAIEKNYSNPNQFFEYNRLKSKELELLKTIPVTLTPFFKYKTNEYFYKFED
ncbi:MAG TPA: hypothetical protein PKN48_08030 [Bacteroidales bacterium]|nr:hypothetical protein [Bacteroidales bacterium]